MSRTRILIIHFSEKTIFKTYVLHLFINANYIFLNFVHIIILFKHVTFRDILSNISEFFLQ